MIPRSDLDPARWENIVVFPRDLSVPGTNPNSLCGWCPALATYIVDRKSITQGGRYVDGACDAHAAVWQPYAQQEETMAPTEAEPATHIFQPEAANKRICATCGAGNRARQHAAQQALPEDATNTAQMECYHCHWRGPVAYNIASGAIAGWCGNCGKDDKLSTTLSSPPEPTQLHKDPLPNIRQTPEPVATAAPNGATPQPPPLPVVPPAEPEKTQEELLEKLTADMQPVFEEYRAPEPEKDARDEGWGWWTVIEGMRTWVDQQRTAVPYPSHDMIPVGQLTPMELHEKLQQFGAALTHLWGLYGMQEGMHIALSKTFASAMSAAKAAAEEAMRREKLPAASTTESAKESRAFNDPDIGEALRETRRRSIEAESLLALIHGMIKAYDAAWTTISRQLTGTVAEMELEKGTRTA